MSTSKLSGKHFEMLGGYLRRTSIPSRRSSNTPQGPKLTVLCRRQVATEFFFQWPNGKIWSPKSGS